MDEQIKFDKELAKLIGMFILGLIIGIVLVKYGVIWTNKVKNKYNGGTKMNYNLINKITGQPVDGITINDTAKEDFMELMDWKEDDWKTGTKEIEKEWTTNNTLITYWTHLMRNIN